MKALLQKGVSILLEESKEILGHYRCPRTEYTILLGANRVMWLVWKTLTFTPYRKKKYLKILKVSELLGI